MVIEKSKKLNTAKKGYTKEKRCRDELKAEGWFITFKSVRFRFGCIDFAELFDVTAIKIIDNKPVWLFISCKHFGDSNNHLPHQKEVKDFKEKYGLEGMKFELWNWVSPRWKGRGINKKFYEGYWIKEGL